MDERQRLVDQHELLQIITDQSELNVKILNALNEGAGFAANAGQSSTQYFMLITKLVEEDDDVDINLLVENHRQMIEHTKKMIALNQEISELIDLRHAEMKRRMEAIDEGLENFR